MRRVVVALILLVVLTVAGSASGGLSVGVNDDAAVDPALATWFFPTLASAGLASDTISLRWDETAPTAIGDQDKIGSAMARARTSGVGVVFDLYPLHSMVFTHGTRCAPSVDPEDCGDTVQIQQFAAWTSRVGQLTALQKRSAVARGKPKSALKAQVAAARQAIALGKKGLVTLTR